MKQRRYFRRWVGGQNDPGWPLLPLTHITSGVNALDIITDQRLDPQECEVMGRPAVYAFYGRAAYRIKSEGVIPIEAVCPFCFVFKGDLLRRASAVYPFDTGAYHRRLYKYHDGDDLNFDDFAISDEASLPNRLIHKVFGQCQKYSDGDRSTVPHPDDICVPGELHVRAYLQMIRAEGRNEPDDRVSSIEAVFSDPIPLDDSLKAMIVPHTLWNDKIATPWLKPLSDRGVEIRTYLFIPGKPPEHYHAHLEIEVNRMLREWGIM